MRILALLLLTLAACADPHGGDAPVLTARFADPVPTANILLDPINLAVDADGVLVAEAHAWRIVRYPRTHEPVPTFGAGLELASATPDRPHSTWIPTAPRVGARGQEFGRILSTDLRGRVLVSGVTGELWTFTEGDAEATRLGAGPGGVALADGVALGAADLSSVTAAALEPRSGRLLVLAGEAVYRAPAAALDDPRRPFVRIAGSGAGGVSKGGQSARSAALRLGDGSLVAGDGNGNVYIAEGGAGRILMVPDADSAAAPLVHLAGGGSSLDVSVAPRERSLEFAPGNSMVATPRDGDNVEILFFARGSPHRLVVDLGSVADGVADVTLDFAAATGARAAGGLGPLGDDVVMTRRDEGTLVGFAAEDTQGRVLVGRAAGAPETPVGTLVPRLGRPGGAVAHRIHGRDVAIFSDDATGKLLSYLPPGIEIGDDVSPPGQPNILVTRTSGTNFELFRNLASVPNGDNGSLLALGSRFKILLFQFESGIPATLVGPGAGVLPLDRLSLGSYFPPQPPVLLGASADSGLVFLDVAEGVVAAVSAPVSAASRIEALSGNASNPRLPLDRPSSLNVVDVSGLVTGTVHESGAGVLVLRTGHLGDLVLGFRASTGRGTTPVAGREIPGRSGIVVAGGGPDVVSVGLAARGVGLSRVSGAAVDADGWVVVVRGADVLVVDALGAVVDLQRDAVSEGASVVPPCGAGPFHLVTREGVFAFAPPEAPSLVHPGPVVGLGCLDGAVSFQTTGPRTLELEGDTISVEAGQITVNGETASGQSMAELEGRAASDARLADDLPVLVGTADGSLVAGLSDCLVSWTPQDGSFTRSTPTRVLYEGPPLADVTALATSDRDLLVASDGRLFRYTPGEGPPGRRGQVTLMAGGGTRLGDGPADQVRWDRITGLIVGPDGSVLIRHAGGVSHLVGDEVRLVWAGLGPAGDHPSMAVDPRSGEIFLPDPRAQQVPRLAAPW